MHRLHRLSGSQVEEQQSGYFNRNKPRKYNVSGQVLGVRKRARGCFRTFLGFQEEFRADAAVIATPSGSWWRCFLASASPVS